MGQLNGEGDLAAAQIAFFAPAFLISLFIVFRHGFSRQLGWFYLVTLSAVRLVGGIITLYIELNNDYSSGLISAAAILNAVGTAPLLLALLGFLDRVNVGMGDGKGFNPMIFRAIQLVALVALILAIVGGTEEDGNSSKLSTAHDCMQAGSVLFLVVYIALAAITIINFLRKSHIIPDERKLIYAGIVALPFLAVRIIYTVIVAFSTSPSSNFYFKNVNVWAESFMRFLMEAIVVMLFITAGLMTPKKAEYTPQPYATKDVEMDRQQQYQQPRYEQPQYERPQYQRPQRNIGDYRPSRMIRNAISGR